MTIETMGGKLLGGCAILWGMSSRGMFGIRAISGHREVSPEK
jgi:hypothetical protein